MHAMQYEITLPADYDMQIIRTRVATGGKALDNLPGLGLKAYAIRERGVLGAPANEYAPIYLWNDAGAMARFLVGGGGFQNIVRDFGRPVVRHWTALACHAGPSRTPYPESASRRLTPIPVGPDPDATGMGVVDVVEEALEDLRRLALHDEVHTAALAIDPHHWQLARLVLWNEAVAIREEQTECYEVLHVSAPGVAELPDGRVW
jgi:hypothetical protein